MSLPCNHEHMQEFCIRCSCPIISCEENNRSYKLQKDDGYRVCIVKYDDEYCDSQHIIGTRADILLFSCRDKIDKCKIAIIIELKGRNIRHAQDQIIQTLKREENNVLREYVVVARIVPTSVPRAHQNIIMLNKLLAQTSQ